MPDHGNDPGSSPPGRHRWFGGRDVDHRRQPAGTRRAAGLAGPPGRYLAIVALLVGTASLPLVAAISAGPVVVGGTALGDTRPFISPPAKGLVVVPLPPPATPPADGQPFAAGERVSTGWSDVPVAPAADRSGWRAAGPNGAISDSGVRLSQPTSPPSAHPTSGPESESKPKPKSESESQPRPPARSSPPPSSTSVPSRARPPKDLAVSRLTWPLSALAPTKAPKA